MLSSRPVTKVQSTASLPLVHNKVGVVLKGKVAKLSSSSSSGGGANCLESFQKFQTAPLNGFPGVGPAFITENLLCPEEFSGFSFSVSFQTSGEPQPQASLRKGVGLRGRDDTLRFFWTCCCAKAVTHHSRHGDASATMAVFLKMASRSR
ncbi:hypothetical protein AMELA_G00264890 [Ameiurus melas]|uniref:Uncharacterized protein n=1 Tax=Ameiurus melas TaxID=219545 RepID=A0A7J5ZRR0_AMEME|nr:hypothetical protein AMELA_G00264890 [Ameiurus melas]